MPIIKGTIKLITQVGIVVSSSLSVAEQTVAVIYSAMKSRITSTGDSRVTSTGDRRVTG